MSEECGLGILSSNCALRSVKNQCCCLFPPHIREQELGGIDSLIGLPDKASPDEFLPDNVVKGSGALIGRRQDSTKVSRTVKQEIGAYSRTDSCSVFQSPLILKVCWETRKGQDTGGSNPRAGIAESCPVTSESSGIFQNSITKRKILSCGHWRYKRNLKYFEERNLCASCKISEMIYFTLIFPS